MHPTLPRHLTFREERESSSNLHPKPFSGTRQRAEKQKGREGTGSNQGAPSTVSRPLGSEAEASHEAHQGLSSSPDRKQRKKPASSRSRSLPARPRPRPRPAPLTPGRARLPPGAAPTPAALPAAAAAPPPSCTGTERGAAVKHGCRNALR